MTIAVKDKSSNSVGTSSTTVLSQNNSRTLLIIQNPSLTYKKAISFVGPAALNSPGSLTLNPGDGFEWRGPVTPDNAITAISDNASDTSLTIYEG